MRPSVRILTGHSAGMMIAPVADRFVAGRDVDAELRFDPERDLAVSTRHAEFVRAGDAWYVTDLGSRNGTFINGASIASRTKLKHGDVLMFGRDGPTAEFRLIADAAGREDTGERVRTAVRRETRRLRVIAASLIGAVSLLSGALLVADRRERAAWDEERAALQLRVDSLIQSSRRAEASLQGEVTGLTAALRESEERLRRLSAELRTTRTGGPEAEELQRQLLSAGAALRRQQLAANLDFTTIQRRNRAAVAMIWVEYADGTRATGTAFAVRADGVLLTNRHLVRGPDGTSDPRRIAIRFADSDQAFPARVLSVSREWDLAALRVDNVLGGVPVIGALNLRSDTMRAGAPVALIGFPLGGEPGADPDAKRIARPVVSAGLITGQNERAIELQGLGAAGGSGSPIVDATGDVIAILFGGRTQAGAQVLLGVPAAAPAAFLKTIP